MKLIKKIIKAMKAEMARQSAEELMTTMVCEIV